MYSIVFKYKDIILKKDINEYTNNSGKNNILVLKNYHPIYLKMLFIILNDFDTNSTLEIQLQKDNYVINSKQYKIPKSIYINNKEWYLESNNHEIRNLIRELFLDLPHFKFDIPEEDIIDVIDESGNKYDINFFHENIYNNHSNRYYRRLYIEKNTYIILKEDISNEYIEKSKLFIVK